MQHPKPLLVDNNELTQIAKMHFGNRSILYPEHSWMRRFLPIPLLYLTPFTAGAFHLIYERDHKILASATLEKMKPTDETTSGQENNLYLHGLCVRPSERGKGYSEGLIAEMFERAATSNFVLRVSTFSDQGKQYLAHKIARAHTESYPHVKVLYPLQPHEIKGVDKYILSFQSFGMKTEIEFK